MLQSRKKHHTDSHGHSGLREEHSRYSVPRGQAKALLGLEPPPGVEVDLVATSAAAGKRLQAWSSAVLERAVGGDVDRAGIDHAAYAPSARARALLRGARIAEADLHDAEGTFSLEEVQALLNGISRQAVQKRVQEGSILAVPGPSNRRRYPAVQFGRDGVVAGLRAVQQALPTANPWAVLNFLVQPDVRLDGRKPIDLLHAGEIDLVVAAARGVGEQDA